MADPQVLYIVTAVVVLGLLAWVIVVLSRSDAATPAATAPAAPAASAPPEKAAPAGAPAPTATTAGSPPSSSGVHAAERGKLSAHDEIRDDPSVRVGAVAPVAVEEEEQPTGPNALILVTAVGRTDPGLKRKHNEDAYAILEDHHLFVIADGMGRHAAGEVASQLCVDAIRDAFRSGDFGPPGDPPVAKRAARIRGAIQLANARILASAQEKDAYAGMGTTVVAAYFSPNNQRVYVAHVGDSRCYRLRGGKLVQLTNDHTLGAAGIQGKSSAVLSRAVGIEESVEVDVTAEAPLPGDVYLLCSDGLSRMVSNEEMEATLKAEPSLDEATRILVDKANQLGGRDNITTIVVRVEDAKASLRSLASVPVA